MGARNYDIGTEILLGSNVVSIHIDFHPPW